MKHFPCLRCMQAMQLAIATILTVLPMQLFCRVLLAIEFMTVKDCLASRTLRHHLGHSQKAAVASSSPIE